MKVYPYIHPTYEDIRWEVIAPFRRKGNDRRVDYKGYFFLIHQKGDQTIYIPSDRTPLAAFNDKTLLRLLYEVDYCYTQRQIIAIEQELKKRQQQQQQQNKHNKRLQNKSKT